MKESHTASRDDDVYVLVLLSLLLHVSNFLGNLLEVVFVGRVLGLKLCLALSFIADVASEMPGKGTTISTYLVASWLTFE